MARKLEFVAGVIEKIAKFQGVLYATPYLLAEEFLRATLVDEPRPPWNTGALRRSGAAYIGTKRVLTTADLGHDDLLGINPSGWYETRGMVGMAYTAYGKATKSIRGSKIKTGMGKGRRGKFDSLHSKVTVVYSAPYAALMHEWPGKFTDNASGAHYVSSKILKATHRTAVRLRHLHASERDAISIKSPDATL
jgi:hypothetical protein